MNIKKHSPQTWTASKELIRNKRLLIFTCSLSILLASYISHCIPNKYSSEILISDEHKESDILLGLNNWTAWMKQSLPLNSSAMDNPLVYAQILNSKNFQEEISNIYIPILKTTYSTHLQNVISEPWWTLYYERWNDKQGNNKKRNKVIEKIEENIKFQVSSKYATIRLQVTDTDPQVAALMVDSVRTHLQKKLTQYRIKKYSVELNNNAKKLLESKAQYEKARNKYANFCDSHANSDLELNKIQIKLLQKDRDKTFELYQKATIQHQRSLVLMHRQISGFALVKNATVPTFPSSPKSIGYILSFFIVSYILTTWYILIRKKYNDN